MSKDFYSVECPFCHFAIDDATQLKEFYNCVACRSAVPNDKAILKRIPVVEISNCEDSSYAYEAVSVFDCKDSVDEEVFRLVLKYKDVITIGKTVGRIIRS